MNNGLHFLWIVNTRPPIQTLIYKQDKYKIWELKTTKFFNILPFMSNCNSMLIWVKHEKDL